MAKLEVPAQPAELTTQYNNLLGVDFQSDQTEVSRRRSPDMVNMISDLGGNPIKRSGYRQIGTPYIGYAVVEGDDWAIKRISNKLYAVKIFVNDDGEIEEITSSQKLLSNATSFGEVNYAFGFSEALYVLCDYGWIEYNVLNDKANVLGVQNNITWKYVNGTYTPSGSSNTYRKIEPIMPDEKFIPTISTFLLPNGSMAPIDATMDLAGATQGVNILTPFRRIEYEVTKDTASQTTFRIPSYSYISPIVKVEMLDIESFDWIEVPRSSYSLDTEPGNMICYTPDKAAVVASQVCEAEVKFGSSPYTVRTIGGVDVLAFRTGLWAAKRAVPTGVPNIRITFAPFSAEELGAVAGDMVYEGYYKQRRCDLLKSKATTVFESKLIAATGIHAYYSRGSEPFKIDDNYYFDTDNRILSLIRSSSALALIAEDTGKNTIYLAASEYSQSLGMTYFTLKASNANVGAISSNCAGMLSDEPIFLAKTGLFGIQTNMMSEKYAVNRSSRINRKLCKEPNLENAIGISFNGYFYLAINNSMYVIDSRHRESSRSGDSSYECYYFDNIPSITNMFVVSNRLFFSDDIHTYTWNDDLDEEYKYLDNAVFDSVTGTWSGEPVRAKWSSTVDADNYPMYYKTLNKKGTMITLSPNMQTSCEVTLIKDGNEQYYIGRFDGTTFSLSEAALDAFTKKKLKKYKRLQFVIENNEAQPFGITNVAKVYTIGNLAKR